MPTYTDEDIDELENGQIIRMAKTVASYPDSEYAPLLAAYVQYQLRVIPAGETGETWSTRELMAYCNTDVADLAGPAFNSALCNLRKKGHLTGCWDYHLYKRHMGNPLIVWSRPGKSPTAPVKRDRNAGMPKLKPPVQE